MNAAYDAARVSWALYDSIIIMVVPCTLVLIRMRNPWVEPGKFDKVYFCDCESIPIGFPLFAGSVIMRYHSHIFGDVIKIRCY